MTALLYSILGAFLVSLLAFLGLITLALKEKTLNKILIYLVSFSAGGLMGGAFFHLLPESLDLSNEAILIFVYVMIGFIFFFLTEKILRWHHCHDGHCDEPQKHLGYLNLIGDSVHNFLDGIIIVSSFLVNTGLGIVVTFSIVFHEIPQELGDFGVLLYSGMKKSKAILFNFLTALFAILGVVIGYFLISWIGNLTAVLVPAAAGGFIYIAASDLVPELHKETKAKSSLISFFIFLLALVFMYLLTYIN